MSFPTAFSVSKNLWGSAAGTTTPTQSVAPQHPVGTPTSNPDAPPSDSMMTSFGSTSSGPRAQDSFSPPPIPLTTQSMGPAATQNQPGISSANTMTASRLGATAFQQTFQKIAEQSQKNPQGTTTTTTAHTMSGRGTPPPQLSIASEKKLAFSPPPQEQKKVKSTVNPNLFSQQQSIINAPHSKTVPSPMVFPSFSMGTTGTSAGPVATTNEEKEDNANKGMKQSFSFPSANNHDTMTISAAAPPEPTSLLKASSSTAFPTTLPPTANRLTNNLQQQQPPMGAKIIHNNSSTFLGGSSSSSATFPFPTVADQQEELDEGGETEEEMTQASTRKRKRVHEGEEDGGEMPTTTSIKSGLAAAPLSAGSGINSVYPQPSQSIFSSKSSASAPKWTSGGGIFANPSQQPPSTILKTTSSSGGGYQNKFSAEVPILPSPPGVAPTMKTINSISSVHQQHETSSSFPSQSMFKKGRAPPGNMKPPPRATGQQSTTTSTMSPPRRPSPPPPTSRKEWKVPSPPPPSQVAAPSSYTPYTVAETQKMANMPLAESSIVGQMFDEFLSQLLNLDMARASNTLRGFGSHQQLQIPPRSSAKKNNLSLEQNNKKFGDKNDVVDADMMDEAVMARYAKELTIRYYRFRKKNLSQPSHAPKDRTHRFLEQLLFKNWVVIVCLLCNLNYLEKQVTKFGDQISDWQDCLTLAVERMNLVTHLYVESVVNIPLEDEIFPFQCTDVILKFQQQFLQRAHCCMGSAATGVNVLNSKGVQLFRKFAIRGPLDASSFAPRVLCSVHLIAELLPTKSGTNLLASEIEKYIASFHELFPDEIGLRVKIAFRSGCFYLQQGVWHEAGRQLNLAYDLCPEGRTVSGEEEYGRSSGVSYPSSSNQDMIYIALCAANLAIGVLPDANFQKKHDFVEFEDLFAAMESGNLILFDMALREHMQFFQRQKILNAIYEARNFCLLHLLLKYYVKNDHFHIMDLVELHKWSAPQLTSSSEEEEGEGEGGLDEIDQHQKKKSMEGAAERIGERIGTTYILPLLKSGWILGVLQGHHLILAKKKCPFPLYESVLGTAGGMESPKPSSFGGNPGT